MSTSTDHPVAADGAAPETTRKLFIAAAIGRARTELAAFDHTLTLAGVADHNLIRLGSVIPAGSEVVETHLIPGSVGGVWGDRLYAVYAEQRTSRLGHQVWAGVGWMTESATGRGLFVEHGGTDERAVRDQISVSLDDLRGHHEVEFGPPRSCVIGATCTGPSTCALVVCAFAVQPWVRSPNGDR